MLWLCAVATLDETNDVAYYSQIGDRVFAGLGPIRSSQTVTSPESVPRISKIGAFSSNMYMKPE